MRVNGQYRQIASSEHVRSHAEISFELTYHGALPFHASPDPNKHLRAGSGHPRPVIVSDPRTATLKGGLPSANTLDLPSQI